MKTDPFMYIVVRRDLNMPAGKMAAQVAHAAVRLIWSASVSVGHDVGPRWQAGTVANWFDPTRGNETKIVLGVDSLEQLLSVQKKAEKLSLPVSLVTDAAYTFFSEPTVTCLGIGPLWAEESAKFRYLKLY